MPDYSSDLFFHTDRSTFYNSAQSTGGQVRPRQTYSKGSPLSFFTFSRKIQNRTCPKGPPFGFFSELCDFFSKIFLCPQRVPPLSFLTFCNGMFVNKSRRAAPFTFFGTMRLLLKENFFSKISIFFQKKCFTLFEP